MTTYAAYHVLYGGVDPRGLATIDLIVWDHPEGELGSSKPFETQLQEVEPITYSDNDFDFGESRHGAHPDKHVILLGESIDSYDVTRLDWISGRMLLPASATYNIESSVYNWMDFCESPSYDTLFDASETSTLATLDIVQMSILYRIGFADGMKFLNTTYIGKLLGVPGLALTAYDTFRDDGAFEIFSLEFSSLTYELNTYIEINEANGGGNILTDSYQLCYDVDRATTASYRQINILINRMLQTTESDGSGRFMGPFGPLYWPWYADHD